MIVPGTLELVVRCAECATRYRLPVDLLGARGGRVRCRECGARFDVLHDRERAEAQGVAAEVVEGLAGVAPRLIEADGRGCLFAEHGAALVAAFDEYRRLAGREAPAAPFRAALRARWSLDLPGSWDERAPALEAPATLAIEFPETSLDPP